MPSQDIPARYDTYIHNAYPGQNYNGADFIAAGDRNGGRYHAYFRFDHPKFDDIPKGANITSGYFRVYRNDRFGSVGNVGLEIAQPNDGWNPTGLTWNNSPTGSTIRNMFFGSVNYWAAVDITDYVNTMYHNQTWRNRGFFLRGGGGNIIAWLHSNNTNREPFLRVYYNALPPDTDPIIILPNDEGFHFTGTGVNHATRVQVFGANDWNGNFSYIDDANIGTVNNYGFPHFPQAPAPSNPNDFAAVPLDNRIRLSWGHPALGNIFHCYKARRQLSDGTWSELSNARGSTITPGRQRYEIQRRREDNNSWGHLTFIDANDTVYIDNSVNADYRYFYRIRLQNSQDTWGGFSYNDALISNPETPIITSVDVNASFPHFRIFGTREDADSVLLKARKFTGNTYTDDNVINPSNSAVLPNFHYNYGFTSESPNQISNPVTDTTEKDVSLVWDTPTNTETLRAFYVRIQRSGVWSNFSSRFDGRYTPAIDRVEVWRRRTDINGNFLEDQWTNLGFQNLTSFVDDTVIPNRTYRYNINNINVHGQGVGKWLPIETIPLPYAPTIYDYDISNGSVILSGTDYANADDVIVYIDVNSGEEEKSANWQQVPENSVANGNEWSISTIPPAKKPFTVRWKDAFVSSEGTYLEWNSTLNDPSEYRYYAQRVIKGVSGRKSQIINTFLRPRIETYIVERRKAPLPGQSAGAEHQWEEIFSGFAFSLIDTEVDFSSTYQYRVFAVNEFGGKSNVSTRRDVNTLYVDGGKEIPNPTFPLLSSPRPKGKLARTDNLNISWNYQDIYNSPQLFYKLRVKWTDDLGVEQVRWWNGTEWITYETAVRSDLKNINVSDIFVPYKTYEFGLKVLSEAKARQNINRTGVASTGDVSMSANDEGYTNELLWNVETTNFYSSHFDTRRNVVRTYNKNFDLYRKVVSHAPIEGSGIQVIWDVKPQIPFDTESFDWEGNSVTWSHVVENNNGYPEPYAILEFIKDGELIYSFETDSRGRINLLIPDDIRPDIYTMRERGTTFAPRITERKAISDPSMAYNHGWRHRYGGPDQILGITKEQIDPQADIAPSMIEGASSLQEIVDSYGSDFIANLEERQFVGYGNFVAEGLDATIEGGTLHLSAGVAVENGRIRNIPATSFTPIEGENKLYVYNNEVLLRLRVDFPPDSAPLYTVIVDALGNITLTDEKLSLPQSVEGKEVTPVRWGASTTNDIDYNGMTLTEVLDYRIALYQEQRERQNNLENEFFADNEKTRKIVQNDMQEREKARESLLGVDYVNAMKILYSLFSKRKARENLDASREVLEDAGLLKTVSYLQSMSSGLSPQVNHISDFSAGDEVSSLTSLLIRDGLATLPNNWVPNERYRLRSLTIDVPSSKYMELHVIYEDVGATFEAYGSLSSNGLYYPKRMYDKHTLRDDALKNLFNTTNNCYIKTFRVDGSGDEAIVELLVKGTSHTDGARIRGWAVCSA